MNVWLHGHLAGWLASHPARQGPQKLNKLKKLQKFKKLKDMLLIYIVIYSGV